jgi:FkbH-like protein
MDIASFRANWQDKAANIRAIAQDLNIGLDSLVLLDDNPFERNLVRQILPMVAVPELPDDDPASWPSLLSDAGYFESLGLTPEDLARTAQYQKNAERTALLGAASDLDTYLRALDMRMIWSGFDSVGRNRIVQLINKTNQFNLTTRRHTDADVDAIMTDPRAFGLQIRLLDRFGDNGIIAVVIGKPAEPGTIELDTWLMSCRVLGRGVERATLNLAAAQAIARGARHLRGRYIPTAKNGLVRDHYTNLGFTNTQTAPDGSTTATLDLTTFSPLQSFIEITEGTPI